PDNAANPDKVFDDTLTVTPFSGATAQGGSVTLNADGSFTYTPSAGNMTGSDSFSYTLSDGFGGTDTATVTIDLTNQNPVATDNSYGTSHNLVLSANAADGTITGTVPAGADYDPDNSDPARIFDDTLTVTPFSGATAQGGSVTLNADGSFTYTPSAGNTTGGDSFTYTLSDGFGGTDTATVTINLTNQDPVATDNSYGNSHNLVLSVNAADGTITGVVPAGADYDPDNAANPDKVFDDTLTVTPFTGATAQGGSVTVNADGSFTYTPSASNTTGGDSFSYTLNDNYGGTDTAIVNITLTNRLPIARPDAYSTNQDVTLVVINPDDVITGVIPAINEDIDPDNQTPGRLFEDTLTSFLMIGGPTGPTANGGTVTLNGDGTFTYTPPAGFSGTDTFLYYVNDGYGNSRPVEVIIDVMPGEIPPPPEPQHLPAAPLPKLVKPEIEGCPVLMNAVATELGVSSETIQVSINRSLAASPNIQPCDACARFIKYAGILSDPNGAGMAAMAQIFKEIAPADMPPSDEMFASIATAFSQHMNDPEMPQYATAMEFIDAFVGYIAIMDSELGSPAGDSTEFAVNKHGGSLMSDNPNVTAYVQMRLANSER
ncbi:MAG: tandem-95 repeat protein, partial [Sedimentisphaerales bacterium]|nr:tandem-95 repeat protein [Sedimentisphaerales bacterium]